MNFNWDRSFKIKKKQAREISIIGLLTEENFFTAVLKKPSLDFQRPPFSLSVLVSGFFPTVLGGSL